MTKESSPQAESEAALSIVTPCFNGSQTLHRCLSSIASTEEQKHIQVIVVDDGSLDDSINCAEHCLATLNFHSRSLIVQQSNNGAPAARNTGLNYVTAPRVIFLDVDDFFIDGFIELILQQSHSNADLVAGNYRYYHKTGIVTDTVLPDDLNITQSILRGQFTIPGAIAVKTEVARQHLWNVDLCADQDGEWTGRMLIAGHSISFHPEKSIAYSLENPNSISRTASRKSIESRALVCETLLNRVNGSNTISEASKSSYRALLAQRLDSIAFNQFHVDPAFCKKLYRRAREISPRYTPLYNSKSGLLRKLLGFHFASRTLMLARR